jgi:hypothetical protein
VDDPGERCLLLAPAITATLRSPLSNCASVIAKNQIEPHQPP